MTGNNGDSSCKGKSVVRSVINADALLIVQASRGHFHQMGALISKWKCSDLAATTDSNPAETLELGEASKGKNHKLPISLKLKSKSAEIEKYSISLAETLNSFRHQELFVDFQIAVSGEDFPVHKNVLAASCKFFRDLFKVSGAAARYELTNVEPTAVGDILNFFYSGKCRLQGQQKAESALSIANFLGIQDLKEPLERYLSLAKESSAFDSAGIWEEFSFCHEESLLKAIMEFWVEGLFCDLTLTTNSGRIVPVHKNVLAAVSCYFQGLFRSDMKEVHENNVDLSMVDETAVNELLHFIYSGEISITFHNIRNLLHATDYLLIEHLRTAIVAFLKGSSTASNFWCIFDLVKSFNCLGEINIDILHLTCSNFWEITRAGEF